MKRLTEADRETLVSIVRESHRPGQFVAGLCDALEDAMNEIDELKSELKTLKYRLELCRHG